LAAALWILGFFHAQVFPQAELVRESLFPADLEFRELKQIKEEQKHRAPIPRQLLGDAALLEETGLKSHSLRAYELTSGGSLKIEIMDLGDKRSGFPCSLCCATSDITSVL
jgi:hypothetical protein